LKPSPIAAVRPAHQHENGSWSIGTDTMSSVLALGLLIALCASANAAKVHHAKPRHVIARPSQAVDPRFPPVLQDQTHSPDDQNRMTIPFLSYDLRGSFDPLVPT
jgi:hypothetical protein